MPKQTFRTFFFDCRHLQTELYICRFFKMKAGRFVVLASEEATTNDDDEGGGLLFHILQNLYNKIVTYK
jgi:hypothetical protein